MITFRQFQETVREWMPEIKRITTTHFFYGTSTSYKADKSPVTQADKEVEEYLVSRISSKFPDHAVVGEETGEHNCQCAEYQWVIDPIDGTRSFIAGVPLFSTLIAFLKDGEPLYGAIFLPVSDDILFGDGHTAILNDTCVGMREISSIEDAVIVSSDVWNIHQYHDGNRFLNLISRCNCFRTWGDGFGYYMLATGKADVMLDPIMSKWDLMAVIPIIRGAGGMITDFNGNDPVKGSSVIAAIPAIHRQVLEKLKQ